MTRLFVYGTLLRGERNHRLLAGAAFLGEARTGAGFRLVDLGSFPAMYRGGRGRVRGEVFAVDAETLAAVDRLEGHPAYYERVVVRLEGIEPAHGYLLAPAKCETLPIIRGGSWRVHRNKLRARQGE
jgi:gamma-glutamylcyclotransferase (GGCT)/AIG2-like uncharacterized protein YtfP